MPAKDEAPTMAIQDSDAVATSASGGVVSILRRKDELHTQEGHTQAGNRHVQLRAQGNTNAENGHVRFADGAIPVSAQLTQSVTFQGERHSTHHSSAEIQERYSTVEWRRLMDNLHGGQVMDFTAIFGREFSETR